HPLRGPQLVALLPMIGLIVACALATIWLAERRDLNASVLREGAVRHHETRWSLGPISLAIRLTRGAAIGWLLGIGAMAFTTGLVAKSASSILSSSPTIQAALGRLGVRKATEGYLGVSFLLIAVMLALLAASQVGAIRDEEASGRLDNLLVRPVSRPWWLAGRLIVSLALVIGVGLATGLVTWFGTSSQHIGVSLGTLLAAGLNASAPGVFVLGAGALVFAVRPALASPAAYAVVAWSFLVNLLGSFLKGLDWLRQTSLLTHIALAPSTAPDWQSVIVLVLLAVLGAWAALFLFAQRDVEYA